MQNNGFHFDQSNQSFKISSVQVWLKAVSFELFQLDASIFQEIHSSKIVRLSVNAKKILLIFWLRFRSSYVFEGGQAHGGICMLLQFLSFFGHVLESQFGSTFRQVKMWLMRNYINMMTKVSGPKICTLQSENWIFSFGTELHQWLLQSISTLMRPSLNIILTEIRVKCPKVGIYFAFFHSYIIISNYHFKKLGWFYLHKIFIFEFSNVWAIEWGVERS